MKVVKETSMEEQTKNKLKDIFNKYDKNNLERKQKQEKIKTEEEIFSDNFLKIVTNIIRPALEELCAVIKERGHACMITDSETTKKATIGLSLKSPESYVTSGRDYPFISFNASSMEKTVWVRISTISPTQGGHTGNGGQYRLDQITRGAVENEVTSWLNQCFNR
jgi:hypothetical protein